MTKRVGVGQPWKDPTDAHLVRAASVTLGTKYIDGTAANKLLSSSTVAKFWTHFLFLKNRIAYTELEIMCQSSRKGCNPG